MNKEAKKLFRISGTFVDVGMASPSCEMTKYYNETEVQYYFFVSDRSKMIIACEDQIYDYVKKCPGEDTGGCKCEGCLYDYVWDAVDGLFTEKEADKINKYFIKHHGGDLNIEEQLLPIDLVEACRMAYPFKLYGGYWEVYKDKQYNLNFRVRGFCHHENVLPDEIRMFTEGGSAQYVIKENQDKLYPSEKDTLRQYRRKERNRNREIKIGQIKDVQEICDQKPRNY